MRSTGWTIANAACMLVTLLNSAVAQQAPGTDRTTGSGVYTEGAGDAGQGHLRRHVPGCHVPASHSGPDFRAKPGTGARFWELFTYINENMPKIDPGSLSSEEYTQVTAYLLKLNGMPAGAAELQRRFRCTQADSIRQGIGHALAVRQFDRFPNRSARLKRGRHHGATFDDSAYAQHHGPGRCGAAGIVPAAVQRVTGPALTRGNVPGEWRVLGR